MARREALEIAQSHATRAEENRRLMPECAAIKAEFLDAFGPGIRITYAEEAGRALGRRDTREGVQPIFPPPKPKGKKAYRGRSR